MIQNNALEILRSFKGKEFTASPSPFMLWLNPVVIEAESGCLSFKYLVRGEWINPMGMLHGGVTAAIMDDVIGATMFSLNEEHFYTTLNNVIDYFATARENDTVIADTRIIKKGKQVVNVQCEIWNADKSRLIAVGHSNLLKTNLKK
ncbi:MAG TPA: PaaI family thioesterase [Bacteroidia bacterium]|nr:PaaI family thioesterase [Bacteroidia bacterium]